MKLAILLFELLSEALGLNPNYLRWDVLRGYLLFAIIILHVLNQI